MKILQIAGTVELRGELGVFGGLRGEYRSATKNSQRYAKQLSHLTCSLFVLQYLGNGKDVVLQPKVQLKVGTILQETAQTDKCHG